MNKRQYVSGDGWRFEYINGELCFLNNKIQWNYKLDELIIEIKEDWTHTIYIRQKFPEKLILKISIYNGMLVYWEKPREFPHWKVDELQYNILINFFNKIL